MTTTIPMMKLRSEPGSVFDRVYYRNETVIVEKSGEPRAVIVPVQEYKAMKQRREEAKARFFEMSDELQAIAAKYDPSEVQSVIDEAVEAVRHEKQL